MGFEEFLYRWKNTHFAVKLALFNALYVFIISASSGFVFGGHIISSLVFLLAFNVLLFTYQHQRINHEAPPRGERMNDFFQVEEERMDRLRQQIKIYTPGTPVLLLDPETGLAFSSPSRIFVVKDIDANANHYDIYLRLVSIDGKMNHQVQARYVRLPEPGELDNRTFVHLLTK